MGAFFEAIFVFFLFGTVGFYITVVAFIIWGFCLIEKESLFGIITSMILFFIFMQFLAKYNIAASVVDSPLNLLWIPGYFAIGFAWSFVKWWLFVNKAAERLKEMKEKFLKEHTDKTFDANKKYSEQVSSFSGRNLKEEWESFIQFKDVQRPLAKKNKGRITTWIIYWPFSFIWSLLNDLIKSLIRQLVTTFQKFYQAISDKAFKGLEDVK